MHWVSFLSQTPFLDSRQLEEAYILERACVWKQLHCLCLLVLGFPGGSDGKESAAVHKTWVQSLGWKDPLEKGVAAHSRAVGFTRNAMGSRLIAYVLQCPCKACHQQLFIRSWVKSLIEVRSWFSFPLNLNIHVISYLRWWLWRWRVHLQCRRPGFNPWVRKIPWRRKWQPTPVFLPGKSHGQRSLAGYSPWGRKESDTIEWLTLSIHFSQYHSVQFAL